VLLAQLLAIGAVLTLLRCGCVPGWSTGSLAVLEGAMAALFSVMLRLPRWWWLLQAAFVPAVVAAQQLQWPGWVYGVLLLLLLLVYGAVFRTGVPLFLSSRATAERLAAWLGCEPKLRLVDLGSGSGRLLREVALQRPGWRLEGVESAWLPWLWSRLAARGLPQMTVLRGDLWQYPVRDCDVVYAFLSPLPMERLWAHVQRGRRRPGWLVSNSFAVPGREPDDVLEVDDRRGTHLYCYRIGPSPGP
jgi:hypothetical protein